MVYQTSIFTRKHFLLSCYLLYQIVNVNGDIVKRSINNKPNVIFHQQTQRTSMKMAAFAIDNPFLNAGTFIAQTSSAAVAYFGLIAYFDRPRGKVLIENPSSALRIGPSQIPNAGLGLYASRNLPKGTKLGTYPGVVRPLQKSLKKLMYHPQCEAYIWRFTDNSKIIDPTDSEGNIQNICFGGSEETPFSLFFMKNIMKFSVETTLTRINEPPVGFGGCNVCANEDLNKREVLFEVIRDINEGEELYMDYGISYDRSSYGSNN